MRLRIPVRIPIHNTGYNKEEFHLNREFSCKKSVRSFLPQFHFSSLQQPRDLKAAAHPRPRMLIIFYMFGSQILIFLRSTVVVCCFSFLQWYSHRFSHAFHIPHSSQIQLQLWAEPTRGAQPRVELGPTKQQADELFSPHHGLIIAKGWPIRGKGSPTQPRLNLNTIKPRQVDQHEIHTEHPDERKCSVL